MSKVLQYRRPTYEKEEETITESSVSPQSTERSASNADNVVYDMQSFISQTSGSEDFIFQVSISEDLVQSDPIQVTTPSESLYTQDSYLVKVMEILDGCLRQLELALDEFEEEITREDTMLHFVNYLHKVAHLIMLSNTNVNFEDVVNAIQVGIENKKGEPYTRPEIIALRSVVKTLRDYPNMSDKTYEACVEKLNKNFELGLFDDIDLGS